MKVRTIKHPRKLVKIMNEFVNKVYQPTYEIIEVPAQINPNETTEQFWERFHRAKEIQVPGYFKMVKDTSFRAYIGDDGYECCRIGYNIEDLFYMGSKQFRQHFINICPMGKGFADITIILLHEIGHFASEQDFDNYDRAISLKELDKKYSREIINFAYFQLPDEASATNWAIEWLQSKENRAIAKAFEKKFFTCFK